MSPKVPGYHIVIGWVFFIIGLTAKHNLPQSIGLLPAVQLPCAFMSSVFVPIGTLMALYGLMAQTTQRRKLLADFLSGLLFLLVILSLYFFAYFIMTRTLDIVKSPPGVLSKLVASARSSPREDQREKMAYWAYRMYGTVIAYPLSDNQIVYYVPSEEAKEEWLQTEKNNSQAQRTIASIDKTTLQFPYLFALYASTYFCTFLIGGIWLFFKLPAVAVKTQD